MERSAASARSSSRRGPRDGGLFDGYLDPRRPHAGAYDEMFAPDGTIRSGYRRLHDQLAPSVPAELGARAEALDRALVDQGITFSLSGQERPFPARPDPPADHRVRMVTARARDRAAGTRTGGIPRRRLFNAT